MHDDDLAESTAKAYVPAAARLAPITPQPSTLECEVLLYES